MGFYLRKSIKLGPVRLSLSKSGVGGSAGDVSQRRPPRPLLSAEAWLAGGPGASGYELLSL